MDFIKQWTFCVCTTLLVSLILTILSPKGGMNRFYKIVISVFIFISFLYPFNGISFDDVKIFDKEILSSEELLMNEPYENMIKNRIKSVLDANGITGTDINASVEIRDNEINVKSVQIAVSSEYDLENVENIIFDNLGLNARVIYNGE